MAEENKNIRSIKNERKEMLRKLSAAERLLLFEREKHEKNLQKEESKRVASSGIPLIFDLSYASSMSESEINSMINQIRLSVGYLRKHTVQYFKLVCCNTSESLMSTLISKGSNS